MLGAADAARQARSAAGAMSTVRRDSMQDCRSTSARRRRPAALPWVRGERDQALEPLAVSLESGTPAEFATGAGFRFELTQIRVGPPAATRRQVDLLQTQDGHEPAPRNVKPLPCGSRKRRNSTRPASPTLRATVSPSSATSILALRAATSKRAGRWLAALIAFVAFEKLGPFGTHSARISGVFLMAA